MDSDLDLSALRGFRAVLCEGSFPAAALALRLPKSTLSKRVADLEADLGVRLTGRFGRRRKARSSPPAPTGCWARPRVFVARSANPAAPRAGICGLPCRNPSATCLLAPSPPTSAASTRTWRWRCISLTARPTCWKRASMAVSASVRWRIQARSPGGSCMVRPCSAVAWRPAAAEGQRGSHPAP